MHIHMLTPETNETSGFVNHSKQVFVSPNLFCELFLSKRYGEKVDISKRDWICFVAFGCQQYHHHHLSAHRAIIWPLLWPEKCAHVDSQVTLSVSAEPVSVTPAFLNRLIKRYRAVFVSVYARRSGGVRGIRQLSVDDAALVAVPLSLGWSCFKEREGVSEQEPDKWG